MLLLPPSLCLKSVDERDRQSRPQQKLGIVCKQHRYISQVLKSKSSAEKEGFWRCKTEIPQKQLTYKSGMLCEKKDWNCKKKRRVRKRVCACVCVHIFVFVLSTGVFPSNEGAFPWLQYFLDDLSKTKPNIYNFHFLLFTVRSLWQH